MIYVAAWRISRESCQVLIKAAVAVKTVFYQFSQPLFLMRNTLTPESCDIGERLGEEMAKKREQICYGDYYKIQRQKSYVYCGKYVDNWKKICFNCNVNANVLVNVKL